MLGLLKDDELYGPYSTVYHAVTEAFQAFGGIAEEIKNAFPGTYPTMNMGGAPISLPEAMGLLGTLKGNPLRVSLPGFKMVLSAVEILAYRRLDQ